MSGIFVQIFVVFWYYILVRLHLYVSQDMYLVRLRWNICTIWYIYIYIYNRRKFRSQTSDSMDRWKKQRWEESEKRRAEERRPEKRKSEKKEDAGARKGSKVAEHCVFSNDLWLRRVESRLAKAGAEPCGVEMSKKYEKVHAVAARSTFGSQMYKTRQGRTTFGSWDVEKVHAVVARSTFPREIFTKHTSFGAFWKLRCRKSARCCGAKHISKSKCLETRHARTTFEGSDVVLRGRCKGFCIVSKVSKTWGFCSISKNDGRCRTFEEDLERCIFRGRRSTRDMFIRDVRRSGSGVAFWSIRSSSLLRWLCVTGAALRMTWPHSFVAGAVL